MGVNTSSRDRAIHVDTTESLSFFIARIASYYDDKQIGFKNSPIYAHTLGVCNYSVAGFPVRTISINPAKARNSDMIYQVVTYSLNNTIARKKVIIGAELITMATSVNEKYLTAMKLTNIEKFPVMTLTASGFICVEVIQS